MHFAVVAAASIRCFQCSSQKDPGCAELSEIYAVTNDTEMTPAMYKLREDTLQLEVITRSCGWEVYPHRECYEFENKGHAETVCQCFDDGCNHAPSLSAPQVLLLPLLATLLVS
ncbi:hypothetical protein B566_EDAN004894 [Ephemera danica]|nr:hypothetical protein B566_EDAN004894 [Ephemera danica]